MWPAVADPHVPAVAASPGASASPSESTARGCAPKSAGQSAVADAGGSAVAGPADDPQLQARRSANSLKSGDNLPN